MTTFLILGIVGLVVLGVSLVVGDVLEGVLGGALDGLGGDWFSTEVIGGFVSALGFGGAIAVSLGAPGPIAVAVGLVVGTTFAWLAAKLTRLVRGAGTDEAPAAADVIGHEGVVISEIPDPAGPGGYGTVQIYLGGHTLRYNASADLHLESGARVHVTTVLSPTAVAVAPVWHELPGTAD